jgi:hypothetical protein
MKRNPLFAALIIMSGLGYSFTVSAEPTTNFTLTTGLDYSSGDYGDDSDTDITSIPIIAKYELERWSFKLTIPYISIKGPGDVIPSIGQVSQTPSRQRTRESGWGDTVASATYTAYQGNGLMVDLTGKIKFDTADEDRGLGTGENDYAVQADVYKSFGKFTAIAGAGYRVYGNPDFGPLDNVFYGSVGGSYRFNATTSAGAIYDYRPKVTSTGSEVSELVSFVSHKLTAQWKTQVYVVTGFSDGSPDYGGGALLGYSF